MMSNNEEVNVSADIIRVMTKLKYLIMVRRSERNPDKRYFLKKEIVLLEANHGDEIAEYFLLGGTYNE